MRMPKQVSFAVIACCIATAVARAQQSPAPALPPEQATAMEALFTNLSADSWQVRQQAQDALVQMGPDARPRLLLLAKQTRDEEVRTRAEAAIRQIEENRIS